MATLTPNSDAEVSIVELGTLKIETLTTTTTVGTMNVYLSVPTGKRWTIKSVNIQMSGTTATYSTLLARLGGVSVRIGVTSALSSGVTEIYDLSQTVAGNLSIISGSDLRFTVGGVAGAGSNVIVTALVVESDL